MSRLLRNRLSLRLALAICLAATAILVPAGVWNLRLQRTHLTRLIISRATERADDIRQSTREAMMRNSPSEVGRIIDDIAAHPTIERIRLFDKQGRIRTSSEAAEVGTLVDLIAEECVSCHGGDETLERLDQTQRARIFTTPDGGRILGVIAPIRNETSCADAPCHAHSPSQTILGVLDVRLSLSEVEKDLAASERQMVMGLAGMTFAVLAVVWLMTWRMVLRPVGRLTEAASRVKAGELSTHLEVRSEDEIGDLTAAWNSMIAKLGRAQIVLERWNKTLEKRVQEKTAEVEKAHQRMLLVEKMASLGKMAAVVAHEINNPLTGIATYAHLLWKRLSGSASKSAAADSKANEETVRILKLIEDESRRCGTFVRNLLLFSRSPEPSFSRAELQPVLDRCALLLEPQARRKEVNLALELQPSLPPVYCDPSQIQQLILALALNAIEACLEGGSVTISARLTEEADAAVLRVEDTGPGIPPDRLDRIFEPFYTTKEEGGGVGLGLAVAYGIASRHGATIEVESPETGGAIFAIELPLQGTSIPGPDAAEANGGSNDR